MLPIKINIQNTPETQSDVSGVFVYNQSITILIIDLIIIIFE